jgi:hypothetical protein
LLAVLAVVLLVPAAPAFAQAVYSYQGNNYDQSVVPGPTFNNSMRVTGSFELTLALPPNLLLTSIGPPQLVDYSFSNGVFTFTPANSTICDFQIATGPAADIVQWSIFLREAGVPSGSVQQTVNSSRIVGARDQGDLSISTGVACASLPGTEDRFVEDNPGVWTAGAIPGVPFLPVRAWVLLAALLAAGGAVILRRTQRGVAQPPLGG